MYFGASLSCNRLGATQMAVWTYGKSQLTNQGMAATIEGRHDVLQTLVSEVDIKIR